MNVMRLQKPTKFLDTENGSDDADAEDSEAMVLDDDEEDAEVSPEYMEFIRKTEEHRKQSMVSTFLDIKNSKMFVWNLKLIIKK